MRGKFREKLADLCHRQWSGWMRYMFEKSVRNPDGTITIPKELVDRWDRQVRTDYLLLPADEMESDRKEADKFLELIAEDYLEDSK